MNASALRRTVLRLIDRPRRFSRASHEADDREGLRDGSSADAGTPRARSPHRRGERQSRETYHAVVNIIVTSLKGGVGKSTTSIYLAAAGVDRGYDPVTLIDADPQASCAEWLELWPLAGITVVEAPSERTATRAIARVEGLVVVDTPPGNERITQSAVAVADAVVIPTRAGGVEYSRVSATIELIPKGTSYGVVICAARLGTNDLDAALAWWKEQKVEVWGVIPERVSIAAGPEARLSREGLENYDAVLARALRGWR